MAKSELKTQSFSRVITLTPAQVEQVKKLKGKKLENFLFQQLKEPRRAIAEEFKAWYQLEGFQVSRIRQKTSIRKQDKSVIFTVAYSFYVS